MAAMKSLDLERFARRTAWRRIVMFGPAALIAGIGTWLMTRALSGNGLSHPEMGVLALFIVTFGWISVSFSAAVIGFVLCLLRRHPVTLEPLRAPYAVGRRLSARVGIVMPIYNEDTRRVFAGLLSTYRSVQATGAAAAFDFHVISDTTDAAIGRMEEEVWADSLRQLGPDARLFYRRRAANIGRKAGNIADWVHHHGANYECMIVLDADSVMSGATIVSLAALMEDNPRTGIIQTLPIPASRETLFARVLQFASRLYGPILAAGQSFWQVGDANYIGHNAIIRIRPFAEHCELPRLAGRPPLGGEILSHDFVEAAFIRRAGWYVWLLPELGGSFEEVPSNLVDYAARDRRWVQGNLQHLWIIGPARRWVGRAHLGMGVLAFATSPLWLLLLLLSTLVVIREAVVGHAYFPTERTLFPIWPDYRSAETFALLGLTLVILLLPKVLALLLACLRRREREAFGGAGRLVASAFAELAFSVLLAPVMMLLHTTFILAILTGRSVGWGAQPRDDQTVSWSTAARRHGPHTAIGLAWAGVMIWFAPDFLPWIAPVVLGLMLAIPVNVLSSRARIGRGARDLGLFRTPEETAPPVELHALRDALHRRDANAARLPAD